MKLNQIKSVPMRKIIKVEDSFFFIYIFLNYFLIYIYLLISEGKGESDR